MVGNLNDRVVVSTDPLTRLKEGYIMEDRGTDWLVAAINPEYISLYVGQNKYDQLNDTIKYKLSLNIYKKSAIISVVV